MIPYGIAGVGSILSTSCKVRAIPFRAPKSGEDGLHVRERQEHAGIGKLDADAVLAVSVLGAWGSRSMMRTPAHYSWQASGRRLGRLDWLRLL